MLKISSTDATIHASQDLVNALQNTAPIRPLVTIGNVQKSSLVYQAVIFGKATSPVLIHR